MKKVNRLKIIISEIAKEIMLELLEIANICQQFIAPYCWNKKCNHTRNGLLAERSRFEIWEVFIFFIFIKAYILYARIQTVCARVQVAWCRVKTGTRENKRGAVRIDNNKDLNSGLRSRDS